MRDLATWEEYLLDSSDGGEEFFDEEEYFGWSYADELAWEGSMDK